MNKNKRLSKKIYLKNSFFSNLNRQSLFGTVFITLVVPYSVSEAVQPKAGDIIESMPSGQVYIDQFSQSGPAISTPDSINTKIKVFVKSFVFRGNSKIKSKHLLEVLSDFINKQLSFEELELAVSLISEEYRSKGFWAVAYLPEQELKDGVVKIQILEGRIGQLRFLEPDNEKNLNLSQEKAKEYILKGQDKDQMLNISALEKSIKTLDNVPGITAAASLVAGFNPGETDIIVSMSNTKLFSGSVRMDNHGSNSAGEIRLSGNVSMDGVFNLGDSLSVSSLKSEGIDYTSIGFNFPIGLDGSRADLSYSFLDYSLGEQFNDIQANGTANNYSLQVHKPLPKLANINLASNFSITHKKLLDKTVAGVSADKTVDVLDASLSFNDRDPGNNVNYGSITLVRGNLNLSGNNTDLSMDKSTANRHGDFFKVEYSLGRLQRLSDKNYISVVINGQVAFDNLDSSEKMSLGGASGVRAYPTGEGMGDTAAVLRTEFRHNFSEKWQGMIFYDHGATMLNHHVWNNWNSENENLENSYQLKGVGAGINLINTESYEFGFYAGRRLGENPGRGNSGRDSDGTLKKLRYWLLFKRKF